MQHQAIRNTGDLKLILGHSAPVRGTHLGELLVRDGVLSEEQLKLALGGNDEVVAYLARGPRNSGERVRFDADLDGSDRVTLDDGTLLARRDGTVDPVDAGPHLGTGETRDGILYRVTFVHDARHAGTGRFRVVEPLLDGVAGFRVRGLDAQGMDVGTCGGADAPFARDSRAAVRRLAVELAIDDPAGGRLVARRDIDLPLAPEARR